MTLPVIDEEEIEVGCGQCSDCTNAGSGDSDLSSIDTQFSVGKTRQGRSCRYNISECRYYKSHKFHTSDIGILSFNEDTEEFI
jgi:hypothetical protein